MAYLRRPKANRLRILVVDDHPMVRERLRQIIEADRDLAVCGEAESTVSALEFLRKEQLQPNLVLVDLMLKNSSGLDLIAQVRDRYPQLPMLVVSSCEDALYSERVIRAGARGFINKQEPSARVLSAIRTVLGGGIYLSQKQVAAVTSKIAGRPRRSARLGVESLTDRELMVFELLGRGCGTREIARQLDLKVRTVETYRARIKEKLNLDGAHSLLQHAIRYVERGTGDSAKNKSRRS